MSFYILKNYVEECLRKNEEPTFEGLNNYNKIKNKAHSK